MNTSSVRDLDFAALRQRAFQPSPAAWEDQVLYFLLLDRFSDGHENGFRALDGSVVTDGTTPLFSASDVGNAIGSETDAAGWREAGGRFCGGTLPGLTSKLGYLRRLGITALWISPLFKQVAFSDSSNPDANSSYQRAFGTTRPLALSIPMWPGGITTNRPS